MFEIVCSAPMAISCFSCLTLSLIAQWCTSCLLKQRRCSWAALHIKALHHPCAKGQHHRRPLHNQKSHEQQASTEKVTNTKQLIEQSKPASILHGRSRSVAFEQSGCTCGCTAMRKGASSVLTDATSSPSWPSATWTIAILPQNRCHLRVHCLIFIP